MKTKLYVLGVFLLTACLIFSCSKDDCPTSKITSLDLPEATHQYYPFTWQNENEKATLGRVLFYDTRLSVNNSISCASCHKQAYGFADNVALSLGFENKLTRRNSPAIQNLDVNGQNFGLISNPSLFWDGRETLLNAMVLQPIVNHVEMGVGNINSLPERLQKLPYYPELFAKAYSSNTITVERIASALSYFVKSINTDHSKFDQARLNPLALSALEQEGRALFFNKYNCNSCHQTQVPNGYQLGGDEGFVNIGLSSRYEDNGRGEFTSNSTDNGRFKIPTLRNISLTAPYMHDGRFATLDQVIDFYSHSISDHDNLDPRLRDRNTFQPIKMNISSQEKEALKAFLNTLNDYSVATASEFSNPFK